MAQDSPDVISKSGKVAASVPVAEQVRVIACGAIAREVMAICRANALPHIDLVCLPAIWHVFPEKIAPAMREAIAEARREGYSRIFIGYAECGTQGELDKICAQEGVERIGGPPRVPASVRWCRTLSWIATPTWPPGPRHRGF